MTVMYLKGLVLTNKTILRKLLIRPGLHYYREIDTFYIQDTIVWYNTDIFDMPDLRTCIINNIFL